jgi:hypothetical protein
MLKPPDKPTRSPRWLIMLVVIALAVIVSFAGGYLLGHMVTPSR